MGLFKMGVFEEKTSVVDKMDKLREIQKARE